MKSRFIAFCLCFLLHRTFSAPHLSQTDMNDNYELPSDEVGDFFRLLLLSRYGAGAPDYSELEQDEKSNYDSYFDNIDPTHQENSFRQAVQNYVNWKNENQQSSEVRPKEQSPNFENQSNNRIESNQEAKTKLRDQPSVANISKEQSTTTSGPDLLASMPPVTPNKGQKEFVMLRPPVENHRKIEHWIQSMADDIYGPDHHFIQKRGSMIGGKNPK